MQSIVLTSVHAESPLFGSVAVAGDTWEVDDVTDGAHDIDITADGLFTIDYTGTDREIFSHNLFDASASSYVGVGYVFINGPHGVVLDSVHASSPLFGTVAVVGDYWEVAELTDGGNVVNIFADGLFEIEYGGTNREIFTHDLFDASAAAFVGSGEVVINNKAPNYGLAPTFPRSFAFRKDQAIAAINLAADYATDPEGDTTVAVALETLPAGLSIVSSILQGTPTKYIAPIGYTIQWTDEYADTYSEEMILGVGGVSRFTRTIRDVDATRPSSPVISGAGFSQSQNNLSWSAASDPQGHGIESVSGVAGYKLYRDGVLIATQPGTTYNDTGRATYTNYVYTVAAYDAAGNVSVLSSPITVRTLDLTAPTAPVIGIQIPLTTETSITVALTTLSTDVHSGVASYTFEYKRAIDSIWNITTSLQPANFPRVVSGLTPNTSYNFQCKGVDNSGNPSAYNLKTHSTNAPAQAQPPVWASNSPPTITFIQNAGVQTHDISVYVSDADTPQSGITITKNAAVLLPTGVTYEQSLKRYRYDGTSGAGGTNGHILTADDGAAANQPPVWGPSAVNQSLTVGVPFSLDLDTMCSDPELQPLTYSIVSGTLPAGLTIGGTRNRMITGTPTTAGAPVITFRASDV